MSNVLCDICFHTLHVVNAILAAVLKQVVLFVLYIDDGQDLGAEWVFITLLYMYFQKGMQLFKAVLKHYTR